MARKKGVVRKARSARDRRAGSIMDEIRKGRRKKAPRKKR